MAAFPEKYRDLIEKKAFAHVGTAMPDGSPQVTPVWWDFDGTHIRINSAAGRVKDRNMRRTPKIALAIMDPDNPYRYLGLRGRIVDVADGSVIVEVTGSESEVDAFVALVRTYGIKELVRTGAVVMTRGSGSIEEALKR